MRSLSQLDGIVRIETTILPRVPETAHNVVMLVFDKDGRPIHAILDAVAIIHPTLDILIEDCPDVDDRRPSLGHH